MDESDGLESRCASHSFDQRLVPMKEAPSFEGAFLVISDTPHREGIGVGYFKGRDIGS